MPESGALGMGLACLALATPALLAATVLPRSRKPLAAAGLLLVLGSVASLAAGLAVRWDSVGAVPLRTPFERGLQTGVGISLGVLLGAFAGGLPRKSGEEAVPVLLSAGTAAGIGFLVVLWGLGGDSEPLYTTPAARAPLAVIHYSLGAVSIGLLFVAVAAAWVRLYCRNRSRVQMEAARRNLARSVACGLPALLAATLIGAVWHETIWASPWSWEPGESGSLGALLVLVVHLHLDRADESTRRAAPWVVLLGGGLFATWLTFLPWLPGMVGSLEFYG